MKEPAGIVEAQLTALLKLLESTRLDKTAALTEETDRQIRDILRGARKVAREKLGRAVRHERAHARQVLRHLEAAVETRRNEAARVRDAALLEAAWPRLEAALKARWTDSRERRLWLHAALGTAAGILPEGLWRVSHPAGVTPEEISAALDDAAAGLRVSLEFHEDPALNDGLVIETAAARLDATIAGLLVRRRAIESALLAACHETGQGEERS
jgi:hypothetical protein